MANVSRCYIKVSQVIIMKAQANSDTEEEWSWMCVDSILSTVELAIIHNSKVLLRNG
jgi:hypothetical protein